MRGDACAAATTSPLTPVIPVMLTTGIDRGQAKAKLKSLVCATALP
jgi:hypothetical protein